MKRLNILAVLASLIFVAACEKEEKTPVLTDMTVQELTAPTEGSNIIITSEILDSNLVLTWQAATYSLSLSNPTYVVQLDSAEGTYAKPNRLANTSELTANVKYSALNKILIDWKKDTALPVPVKIRILSNVAGQLEQISDEVFFDITPYIKPEPIDTTDTIPVFVADTIYLVGSATTVGWSADLALPIVCTTPDSVYTISTELIAGGMKVLKYLGQWAPQWGTDDTGTNTGGPLVFRPDEITTDPPEIPSPGAGTFKIVIDIINLTYTITPI